MGVEKSSKMMSGDTLLVGLVKSSSKMMSGDTLLSLSMSDSYEPAPVSLYLAELQSLQGPFNLNAKLGDSSCGSLVEKKSRCEVVNDTRNSISAIADDKVNAACSHANPCPRVIVGANFPTHQNIAQSCPFPQSQNCAAIPDWHTELILATQTLQAFSMVDRGELDWDD
jgi:hypothetical protein